MAVQANDASREQQRQQDWQSDKQAVRDYPEPLL